MDPPSPQLIRRLTMAGLCRPADLRRCRARVRRLARDVPAFETVWLDALVQTRRLTAFQAELLGSDDPGRLHVGPFVLIDRAGDDGRFVHYHARRVDSTARFQLSTTRLEPDSSQSAEARLQAFLDRTASVVHPALALPRGFEHVNGRLWVAAPWTGGTSLRHLLVRRGRFATASAAGIAAQLCEALSPLEDAGAVHGDLRLRNIVLTTRGQCVLTAGGLRAAMFQEQSFSVEMPPEDCDGIAPELIGSGRTPNVASDLYALGCLLWELLAGRPPYPHGDPLARLAAHQKLRIPDIRELAPDTPGPLAELICELTQPAAESRPASFRVVAGQLQRMPRASARQLLRVMREPVAALTDDRLEVGPRRAAPALAAGLLCVAAGGLLLLNPGARGELLNIARSAKPTTTVAAKPEPSREPTIQGDRSNETLSPLPEPDETGVVRLSRSVKYAAGDLAFAGRLQIRSSGPGVAVIVCDVRPLRVSAMELVLENIELRGLDGMPGGEDTAALVELRVQNVAVRQCRFEGNAGTRRAAVAWTPLDAQAVGARRCLVADCVFQGGGAAVVAGGPPSAVSFDNVLHAGAGPLLEISNSQGSARGVDVAAHRTTLRGPASLIACRMADGMRTPSALRISLEESVLELAGGAMLEFLGTEAPVEWQRLVQITGEGTVIPPGAMIAGVRSAPDRLRPVSIDDLAIDGLMSTAFEFAGPAVDAPADSAIVGYAGYGRSERAPGIDPARLLPPGRVAYNSSSADRSQAAAHSNAADAPRIP